MSDLCYSWPMFNRIFHQVELMDRMMEVLGVNPAIAVRVDKGEAWYEARTTCISCCDECACRNWLECSEGVPMPPDFCPTSGFSGTVQRQMHAISSAPPAHRTAHGSVLRLPEDEPQRPAHP